MTIIEFFIGGILFTFGTIVCVIFISLGVIFVGMSISILVHLAEIRILLEFPLSILGIYILYYLDTHGELTQTIHPTIPIMAAIFTAIMVVDTIMYFINKLERKIQGY